MILLLYIYSFNNIIAHTYKLHNKYYNYIAPSPLETTFSISINGTNVEACVTTKEGQKFKIILRDANLKRQRGIGMV